MFPPRYNFGNTTHDTHIITFQFTMPDFMILFKSVSDWNFNIIKNGKGEPKFLSQSHSHRHVMDHNIVLGNVG